MDTLVYSKDGFHVPSRNHGKRILWKGSIFKHFKGDFYKTEGLCQNTEIESGDPIMVRYIKVGRPDVEYVRPLGMFLGKTDKDKYPEATQEYRFEYCFNISDL